MRWVCIMMGLVLSHYSAIQGLLCVSEVMSGDMSDLDKPFKWDNIRLNLPRDPNYSQKSLGCQNFEGVLKSRPCTLSPMWMTTEWRQRQNKRSGVKTGEWGLFGNNWA